MLHPALLAPASIFIDEFNADQHVHGSDSFNRADSAVSLGALDGGQLSGAVWTSLVGTIGISSNKAYAAVLVGDEAVSIFDSGMSDAEFAALTTATASGDCGLIFRQVDVDNYLITIIPAANSVKLYERVAGSFTELGTASPTAALNAEHTVKVVARGSSIQVFVNGVRVINVTTTRFQTATGCGLRIGGAGSTALGNSFSVKAIVPSQRWTKVDTESKITQANGLLSFSAGKATPAWGDPAVVGPAVVRRAGVMLEVEVTPTLSTQESMVGFHTDTSPGGFGAPDMEAGVDFFSGATLYTGVGTAFAEVAAYVAATTYRVRLVLGHWDVSNRLVSANGYTAYIQGGIFGTLGGPTWALLARHTTGSTALLYAALESITAALGANYVRVSRRPFPMPKVYDSMVRANGAIGSAESGQAYVEDYQGTATILSNEGWFSTNADSDRFRLAANVGNGIVSVDIKGEPYDGGANWRNPQLCCRLVSNNTFLMVDVSAVNCTLYKIVAGVSTILSDTGGLSHPDNTYKTVAVLLNEAVVKVFIDGVLRITHTLTGGNETTFSATAGTGIGVKLAKGGSPSIAARFKNLVAQGGLP